MSGRNLDFSLTPPQADFVLAQDPFPAIVAGFGAGKTSSLCKRLIARGIVNPKGLVGFYEPTYDAISTIALPELEVQLEAAGIPYKYNQQSKLMRTKYGRILFRSMEQPHKIVGFQTSDAGVDELDTLPAAKAKAAWIKIIARNRLLRPDGTGVNSVAVATTPEGFRFVYETWKKDVKALEKGYRLIRASTYSNAANLAADYVLNLQNMYPPNLLAAYLEGQFVNLASGSVYADFDRDLNGSKVVMRDDEPLYIGMDFNVLKMACAVFVIRDGLPIAVDEIVKGRDTPHVIEIIKTRYGNKGRSISMFPDPSGNNPSSKGASLTDFVQIRQAGLTIYAPSAHPPVRDRVNSVNAMILNAAGERRLRVNVDKCPNLAETLEQQIYSPTGEPDKLAGLDHLADALGYFIHFKFPIAFRSQRMEIIGL
jgi:hypothetical protein